MGVLQQVKVTGSITMGPVLSTSTFPALRSEFDIGVTGTHAENKPFAGTISTPAPAWLDLLAGTQITKVRKFAIKIYNGSLDVRLTTAGGADQVVRVSELWVWASAVTGDEITALAVQGSANVEMLISGDA